MLSGIRSAIFRQGSENRVFCFKWGALIISMLQRWGFVKKAERAVSPCNKAVIALRRRPPCTAKRPLRECREALTAAKRVKNRVSKKQRKPYGFSGLRKTKCVFFRIITTKGSALPPSISLSDRKLLIYATITPKSSKFASV